MKINQEKITPRKHEDIETRDLSPNQLKNYQKLDKNLDSIEQHNSSISEKALNDIREIAIKSEKSDHEKKDKEISKTNHQTINKKTLNISYSKTLKGAQTELNPSSRAFSKFIHNSVIESVSNMTGNTLARPNAILFGALVSFVSTLSIYIIAKKIGYTLSGFEPIISFSIGWVLGIIYDYFKLTITGRK